MSRWCARDSNPRWQDGRRRRIHWAMAAPQVYFLLRYLVSSVLRRPHHFSGQSNFFITAFDSWIKVCFNVLMLPLCHCNYFNFFSFVRSTTVWLQLSASFFNEIVKTVKMCIEKLCFGSVQWKKRIKVHILRKHFKVFSLRLIHTRHSGL